MSGKQIIEIVEMLFSSVLSVIVSNSFPPIITSILIGVILLLVILMLLVIDYYKEERKALYKTINDLKINVNEVTKQNKEFHNFSIKSTRGNSFF